MLTATTSVGPQQRKLEARDLRPGKDVAEQVRGIQLRKDHPAWLPQ